ncbi:glycosyltransferase [Methylocystis heyeri]|uniref:Glycosyltransferase n=1 Tax=Methylocystis heyeri TaxID=391905 RepID=A0A6B8K889_9HYPH|nr:glycosyltransferase [Methylocystis heyeri]QGM44434.1 glycosyltransferase [Methylocystis heyeri]
MDILLVHCFYQQVGGEDLCVRAESALLKSRGHNVVEYFLDNAAIADANRLAVAAGAIWNRAAYRRVREICRSYRPQIVHFHNTMPLVSPSAYYAAKAENAAVVQTLHNYRLACPNGLFFQDKRVCESCLGRRFPWPGVLRRCYRGSLTASATIALMTSLHRLMGTWENAVDTYIALSEFQKNKLIRAGLPGSKIVIKPNFSERDAIGRGDGRFALYAGRLSPEKGVSTLLDAWKLLDQDIQLTIAGEGPESDLVERAAAQDGRINFLGHVSGEQICDLAGRATTLIAPSLCYENFPRVIVEAFSRGTPVICSRFGAMPEIVADGEDGLLFTPSDAADLAEKVKRLFGDPGLRKRMRKAALHKFVASYAPQSNYLQLMAAYGRALNLPRQREQAMAL